MLQGVEVARLLEEWGLVGHAARFEEEEIVSLEMMAELAEKDLKELGLKMGERKAFLKKVKNGHLAIAPATAVPSLSHNGRSLALALAPTRGWEGYLGHNGLF